MSRKYLFLKLVSEPRAVATGSSAAAKTEVFLIRSLPLAVLTQAQSFPALQKEPAPKALDWSNS
ncbi:MAG TPA: hypothetical protein VHQ64_05470, partial [Pyrinomonadaceae bacterium]|nr:hypothetical protein [Pyrinomonadaceae bacterium]